MATTTEFFADKHEYFVDGAQVPSVTQVLELSGLCDLSRVPVGILETAKWRGSQVHAACEFLDQNDLDFATVPEECLPYVMAYEQFKRDSDFAPDIIEQSDSHELDGLKYGLTVDRVGTLDSVRVLLDLKCTYSKERHWAIQTAAYAAKFEVESRGVLWLRKTGHYELIWHENENDIEIFTAALRIAHWKLDGKRP
jgi:hypothetical protein